MGNRTHTTKLSGQFSGDTEVDMGQRETEIKRRLRLQAQKRSEVMHLGLYISPSPVS